MATHQSFVRRPDTAVAIGPPARGTPGHLALAASHWHDRRMSRYQAFDSIDPGDSMQGRPFVVFAAFLAACVGCSKTSPEPGCPGPWSSDPCVTGTVCEYSSPLTCEPGCSGGSYSRWECINGQWEDSMHTAGGPSCYCPPTDAQADGSPDAGAADTPEAPEDCSPGDG